MEKEKQHLLWTYAVSFGLLILPMRYKMGLSPGLLAYVWLVSMVIVLLAFIKRVVELIRSNRRKELIKTVLFFLVYALVYVAIWRWQVS